MQNKQHSPVLLRTKQKLHENIKAFVIILILQLCGLPLMSVTSQVFYYREMTTQDPSQYNDQSEIYILISAIFIGLAVLAGIIIPLKNFSYLYKKTEVDMNLSLPVTSSQRFLSDFFSGLAVYIIPYIIAVILTLISFGIGKSVYPEFYSDIFKNISLAHCLVCGLLTMIMLYTLTILVTVCCGNMFESFIYTLLINAIIPIFFIVIDNIIFSVNPYQCHGISPFIETLNPVMMTSPFGGILKLAEYIGLSEIMYSFIPAPQLFDTLSVSWHVKYSVLIIVLFLISFMLYNKRKAEDVSKPFVFSFIYYVFSIALIICISGTLFWDGQYINAIIISVVIFAILEIIRNRGIKHVLKGCIYYTASIVISFSFVKISSQTDGFGQIYKTPHASDIKAVSLSYLGFYRQGQDSIKFTDTKDIELILKMQSDTFKYYKENSGVYKYKYHGDGPTEYSAVTNANRYYPNDNYCEVAYLMKNGNTVYRAYFVPYHILTENTVPLSLNQEYKDYLVDKMVNRNYYNESHAKQLLISYSKGSIHFEETQPTDSDYIHELKEAYTKDIEAQTEDDIRNFELYCTINNNYIGRSFTNTLRFLGKHKIDLSSQDNDLYKNDSDKAVLIADSDNIIKNNNTSTNIITESCGTPSQYYTFKYDTDLLAKLMQVAQPHYYTDKHCYVISFANTSFSNYIIPPEYSELAEEFMASAELNDLVWEKREACN